MYEVQTLTYSQGFLRTLPTDQITFNEEFGLFNRGKVEDLLIIYFIAPHGGRSALHDWHSPEHE